MAEKKLTLKQRIIKDIEEINKTLSSDEGKIFFVSLKQKVLQLKYNDKCKKCPVSKMTFNKCIVVDIKDRFPELVDIVLVD